jgi:hypothetical protein
LNGRCTARTWRRFLWSRFSGKLGMFFLDFFLSLCDIFWHSCAQVARSTATATARSPYLDHLS